MNRIRLIIIIIALTGCNKHKEVNPSVKIDLDSKEFQVRNVKLSTIASKIEYVPLETVSESIIGQIRKLVMAKDNIFIFDRQQNILLRFDRHGHYLNRVGQVGNGPQEYGKIQSYSINEIYEEVSILTYEKTIITYSYSGDYKRTGELDEYGYSIHNLKNKLIITYPYPYKLQTGNYLFGQLNAKGRTIERSLFQTNKFVTDKDRILFNSKYVYLDTLVFWEKYSDTAYSLSYDMKVKPRFIFNYGKTMKPKDWYHHITLRTPSDGLNLHGFLEDRNRLYILNSLNRRRNFLVYDKNCHKAYRVVPDNSLRTYGFTNDLDGGFPFWPIYANDSTLISIEEISNLKENLIDNGFLKNSECIYPTLKQDLFELIRSSPDETNPILIILHLK